jgi:hypothetical protein
MSAPIDPSRDSLQESQGTKEDLSVENSKEKLDARLDHGIKESFPGSDPVSVEVSKYAPGDAPGKGGEDAGDRMIKCPSANDLRQIDRGRIGVSGPSIC